MAYNPLFGPDGNGWYLDEATGDIVLLHRSAVIHRITKAGATTITGALAATGAISGASAAVTGAVSAASAAVTGAVAAGSAAITGAVSAASASVTGTVAAGSLKAGATTALVKIAKTTLTAAQLKALAASPITVVAAVADKMHQFLGALLKFNVGSELLAEPSAPDEPVFRYVDGTGTIVSSTIDATVLIAAAADAYASAVPILVDGIALAAAVNVPIVLHNTGGEYTGNASNDASLEVTVAYIEHDVS